MEKQPVQSLSKYCKHSLNKVLQRFVIYLSEDISHLHTRFVVDPAALGACRGTACC